MTLIWSCLKTFASFGAALDALSQAIGELQRRIAADNLRKRLEKGVENAKKNGRTDDLENELNRTPPR